MQKMLNNAKHLIELNNKFKIIFFSYSAAVYSVYGIANRHQHYWVMHFIVQSSENAATYVFLSRGVKFGSSEYKSQRNVTFATLQTY